ncbi:hypothetical protein TA3x_004931 [Tundrisphaera sp. TA3]|uniref:hypothetical protein n=1 Tax=Tundrisphaera sp. TA3 TaxID=3435775 RepID=UPI003EBDAB71
MLPPIRYPLPSLVILTVATLAIWQGEAWTRDARAALAARLRRAVEGPPIPASPRPQVIVGKVTRRALLLDEVTEVAVRPGGRLFATIDARMFVEVYDAWPPSGPATHLRIGHGTPTGWARAKALLPWNTRLVAFLPPGPRPLRPGPEKPADATAEVGTEACPVLSWTDEAIEVAVWDRSAPWWRVARTGWIRIDELPADVWGAWISDVELPIALRLSVGADPSASRTLAALGHLIDGQAWSKAEIAEARRALPPWFPTASAAPRKSRVLLAEANAQPKAEASWGGFSFRALPLDHFP